ncbi:unnamed protein product [Linum tenue]|uniref:Uncharacterized protein n=1 Tax=Linum tenue TaxID=586396 RepID=A0AAV0KRA1_9ROSI|nr:unnamed protein product [Linum tenue]
MGHHCPAISSMIV